MKKFNNKKLFATSALVLGLAVLGAGVASADTTSSTANPMSNLVSAIATKFNLNTSDVQAVFDAQRTEMDATRAAEEKARLATAVTDGKLTQAQADAITTKKAELAAARETNRTKMETMTEAERKVAMETERSALQSWATANNIPTQYMMFLGGHGGKGHGGPIGGERGPGMMPQASANTTTTTTAQ